VHIYRDPSSPTIPRRLSSQQDPSFSHHPQGGSLPSRIPSLLNEERRPLCAEVSLSEGGLFAQRFLPKTHRTGSIQYGTPTGVYGEAYTGRYTPTKGGQGGIYRVNNTSQDLREESLGPCREESLGPCREESLGPCWEESLGPCWEESLRPCWEEYLPTTRFTVGHTFVRPGLSTL